MGVLLTGELRMALSHTASPEVIFTARLPLLVVILEFFMELSYQVEGKAPSVSSQRKPTEAASLHNRQERPKKAALSPRQLESPTACTD